MEIGEGIGTPTADSDQQGQTHERTCPACGAVWTRTEPTLADVRSAIHASMHKYADDLAAIEAGAYMGYRGSVARGTVGNPNKVHFEYEPDIRGECGIGYDVDGFTLMDSVYRRIKPDRFGKRWAARDRQMRSLERRLRSTLTGRSELAHMKKGRAGFELLVRHHKEQTKLFSKGAVVIVLFGKTGN